jgi:hypothetical protein
MSRSAISWHAGSTCRCKAFDRRALQMSMRTINDLFSAFASELEELTLMHTSRSRPLSLVAADGACAPLLNAQPLCGPDIPKVPMTAEQHRTKSPSGALLLEADSNSLVVKGRVTSSLTAVLLWALPLVAIAVYLVLPLGKSTGSSVWVGFGLLAYAGYLLNLTRNRTTLRLTDGRSSRPRCKGCRRTRR